MSFWHSLLLYYSTTKILYFPLLLDKTALCRYNYSKSRYYSPTLGRFISPDGVEYLEPDNVNGLNLYAYCYNNPIMYADPSGNLAFFILTAIIGAIAGVGIT